MIQTKTNIYTCAHTCSHMADIPLYSEESLLCTNRNALLPLLSHRTLMLTHPFTPPSAPHRPAHTPVSVPLCAGV